MVHTAILQALDIKSMEQLASRYESKYCVIREHQLTGWRPHIPERIEPCGPLSTQYVTWHGCVDVWPPTLLYSPRRPEIDKECELEMNARKRFGLPNWLMKCYISIYYISDITDIYLWYSPQNQNIGPLFVLIWFWNTFSIIPFYFKIFSFSKI